MAVVINYWTMTYSVSYKHHYFVTKSMHFLFTIWLYSLTALSV